MTFAMQLGIALLCVTAVCATSFDEYTLKFNKAYATEDEKAFRRGIYEQRLAEIHAHNNAIPAPSYKKGISMFTDRTDKERKTQYKGLNKALLYQQKHLVVETRKPKTLEDVAPLPSSVDWRTKGVLTPVKNQGQCGSCWTFASTETLEAHYAIKTGILEELSEQFVLDCTPNPQQCGGTGGCAGGTAELAYARLVELGGIPSEWTYPYISGLGAPGTCHGLPLTPEHPHSGSVMAAANLTSFYSTPANSYYDIIVALSTGPLAVSVDASAWHDYSSGIFDGGNSTNPDLDHLVQLVGYGTEEGIDYWIVRNSWTPYWGEAGFIRVARQDPSKLPVPCGTDITPADGNGCKGGPSTVVVCGTSGILYDGVFPII